MDNKSDKIIQDQHKRNCCNIFPNITWLYKKYICNNAPYQTVAPTASHSYQCFCEEWKNIVHVNDNADYTAQRGHIKSYHKKYNESFLLCKVWSLACYGHRSEDIFVYILSVTAMIASERRGSFRRHYGVNFK